MPKCASCENFNMKYVQMSAVGFGGCDKNKEAGKFFSPVRERECGTHREASAAKISAVNEWLERINKK